MLKLTSRGASSEGRRSRSRRCAYAPAAMSFCPPRGSMAGRPR